ncbi:hypothetical protein EDB84DRAFT_1186165 [Lactarius hengduanensis]|nr:hypothetical protein EDB84DRAFT_1186165 [Lactarius hengduanensis]
MVALFHAAFSTTNTFLISFEGALKTQDLSSIIVLESLLALFLGIIGACVKAPALQKITLASEMNTRIWLRTIANMDTRMCFTNFVTTGRVLGQDRANRADQRRG